jgi:hypothetical protein
MGKQEPTRSIDKRKNVPRCAGGVVEAQTVRGEGRQRNSSDEKIKEEN